MPISSILVVGGIITAFTLFGVVLAWADYRTWNLYRDDLQPKASPKSVEFKRAA